jgi:hypothetical protein
MRIKASVLCLALLVSATNAHAGTGISARVGTLGLGLDLTQSLVPMVNARLGFSYFTYTYSTTTDGIDYDYDLNLGSGQLLLDFHPVPLMGFRVSGGALINGNNLDMTSDLPDIEVQIGDETYTASDVGELTGEIDLNTFAPYIGIGWGNAASSRISINTDLGVVFQGSPSVALNADGPLANEAAFQEQLELERQSIEDDLDIYKYYPVASIGIGIKFTLF